MISPIVIRSLEGGWTGEGTKPAQPCATRDSAQINPTCVSGETHPHGIAGVRELVTVRIRVGSGRAHRCIYPVLETPQLARIQFQSAAARFRSVIPAELLPSGRWTAGSALPVWRCFRPFILRAVKVARHLFPRLHSALAPFQSSARSKADVFQVLSLSARVLGLAAGVVGQHTDRRKMKCPTKALKDSTK